MNFYPFVRAGSDGHRSVGPSAGFFAFIGNAPSSRAVPFCSGHSSVSPWGDFFTASADADDLDACEAKEHLSDGSTAR